MTQRTAYSIDRRVFRGSLLALVFGLSLSSVLSYWSTRHEVGELFDAQLIENARFIKGIANQKATADDWQSLQRALEESLDEHIDAENPMFKGHAYEKKLAVQVWSQDGQLIVRSPSSPRHALAPLQSGFSTFDGDSYDWKVYTVWLDQNQHWLVVAERTDIRGELSENIEAISIVDNYLEHSRIYIFGNAGSPEVYISSADFMTRNLDARIEVTCPIYDQNIKNELIDNFDLGWKGNVKARFHSDKLDNKYRRKEI